MFYSDNGSTAVEVGHEDGEPGTGATRDRRAAPSSRCITPITAIPSARCPRAKRRCSRSRSRRCCSMSCARTHRTAIAARWDSSGVLRHRLPRTAGAAQRPCRARLGRHACDQLEQHGTRRRGRAGRADAAGRRRNDRLAGGVPRWCSTPVRRARRADDRRRSADRLRPHGPALRMRTRRRLRPDIICLSKAVTGGYLPLGVTAATERIYDAFLSDDRSRTFFHGHSFTGNPLACALAIASLDLIHETKRGGEGGAARTLAAPWPRAAGRSSRGWRRARASAVSASSNW